MPASAVGGVLYQVDPNLAGETVVLWWGLFDQELYVEHGARRYGPYQPLGGPIPLHRYRRFKKTVIEQRAERIEALAAQLVLPRAAADGAGRMRSTSTRPQRRPSNPLSIPIPFQEFAYPDTRGRQVGDCGLFGFAPGQAARRSSSTPSRRC